MKWWLKDTIVLKLVSVLIALILWILVLSGRNYVISRPLLLRLKTPSSMVVSTHVPDYIHFQFRGPKVILNGLEKRLENLVVDLTNYEVGEHTITFHVDMLGKLPVGVFVTAIEPPSLSLKLEPVQERVLDVVPDIIGEPAEGYQVLRVEAQPKMVVIRGAASQLLSLTTVKTAHIPIDGLTKTAEFESQVVYEFKSAILQEQRAPIKVRVEIQEVPQKQRFAGIPIQIQGKPPGEQFIMSPQEVEVTVEGPRSLLKSTDFDPLKQIKAHVVLSAQMNFLNYQTLPVHIEVPRELLIVDLEPKRIRVKRDLPQKGSR